MTDVTIDAEGNVYVLGRDKADAIDMRTSALYALEEQRHFALGEVSHAWCGRLVAQLMREATR